MLLGVFCVAQNNNIKLPKGIEVIKFSSDRVTAIFDVYLQEDGIVHVKDSLVTYNELGNLAFKFNIEHPINEFNTFSSLYIDVKTPYKYVDVVIQQLRQARIRYFYRTGDVHNVTQGMWFYLHRPTFFHRSFVNGDVNNLKLIAYEYAGYEKKDLIQSYLDNLYARKFKIADDVLSKMKYTKIKFLENGFMLINGVKIISANVEKIYNELKNNDICFIEYQPDLLYGDYFKCLRSIRKVLYEKKNKQSKNIFLMPITGELNEVLIKENIKL